MTKSEHVDTRPQQKAGEKSGLAAIKLTVAIVVLASLPAGAQISHPSSRSWAPNVVIPQARAFAIGQPIAVEIADVRAEVHILGQVATTTLDIRLLNPTDRRLEAELIVPVPDGAMVRGFAFEGMASEPTAKVLPREEARRTYDGLVASIRDPALLEFLGYNLIRSSVFPVEGRGTQKVRLTYEHLLSRDGDRIDYVLPRSESLDYRVPWNIEVRIQSERPLSTVYSPSHMIETTRAALNDVRVHLAPGANMDSGPFRMSLLLEGREMTASLLAYPDTKGEGGYFLLLAGTPAIPPGRGDVPAIRREVILVLDRSGSMSGEKIEQVRRAALQVISGLEEGETFNLIVYNGGIDLFALAPVAKNETTLRRAREYLDGVNAVGGTNIHEALLTALHQKPTEGSLPIVLFLTDGLPTMGQTSEVAIRAAIADRNPGQRRIFTFGVGMDVNTPLLDHIAAETRARSTYVLPGEDVEVKVARQFQQLSGPVLADLEIHIERTSRSFETARFRDMIPARPPDLFHGDQLVLLGRYTGNGPVDLNLTGNFLGETRTFRYHFDLDRATTRNAFVPRLWASRKIATLVDAIRLLGADSGSLSTRSSVAHDPRFKELVDEIVRLSTEFGILTEYTAFLAEQGSDLSNSDGVLARAGENFYERAVSIRTGEAAVEQSLNLEAQVGQRVLNPSNSLVYLGERSDLGNKHIRRNIPSGWTSSTHKQSSGGAKSVSFTSVRQVNDRTFFRRQEQWVDSRILDNEGEMHPTRTIEFGSKEFLTLAHRLAEQGRQGMIALEGDILIEMDGQSVLIRAAAPSGHNGGTPEPEVVPD